MSTERDDLLALVEQIKSSSREGGGIAFLLTQLSPETAFRFRLSAIPHYFDADILGVLDPSLSADEARSLCDEFADFSVVTDTNQGQIIHDKTRNFLFQQWLRADAPDAVEFQLASSRLTGYFASAVEAAAGASQLQFEHRAYQAFHQLGADQDAGLNLFAKLFHKSRLANQLNQCETLLGLLHEYDAVLREEHRLIVSYHEGELALVRRDWPLARRLLDQVAKNAEGRLELRVKAMMRLGIALAGLNEWGKAETTLQHALSWIDRDPSLETQRHNVQHELAVVMRDSSNAYSDQAERLLGEAIEKAQQYGDFSSQATILNTLGTLYLKHRRISKATKALHDALVALDQSGDRFRKAPVYNNLGLAQMEQRNWQAASDYFEKALGIQTDAGHLRGQAFCLNNLSRAYQNLNRMEQAVDVATQASQLFARVADSSNAAVSRRNLGRIFRRINRLEEARAAFNVAIEWFRQGGEEDEAKATEQELKMLGKKQGIPVWGCLIPILLFLSLFLFGFLAALLEDY